MLDGRVSAVVYRQRNVDDTGNVFIYESLGLNLSLGRSNSVDWSSQLILGEFGANFERPNYPRYIATAVTKSEYSALFYS